MAGKRRDPLEENEPIMVVHEIGVNDAEWPKMLADARERSKAERRVLIIVNKPQHTPEEQARIEKRLADAAAEMIRSYIIRMEKKIADGLASAAEAEKYRTWYRANIKE